MSEARSHASSPERLPFNLMPTEFAEMGKKRVEDFAKAQAELLEKVQECNRHWVDRFQSEAQLASEFASKLTAARSIPDAMAASQEWSSRRIEMMAEDARRLVADTQTFLETGARLLSNGCWPNGAAGVSVQSKPDQIKPQH